MALVGAGLVGRRHAVAIRSVRNVDLVAVVDPADEGRSHALDNGIPHFASMSRMFEECAPDGVILATPTTLHVGQGLECVERGCPVFVEKPIAVASDEALVLGTAADRAQVPILVGNHRRHNPLIQAAHEAISSGRVGAVRAVHANCWFYKPDEYFESAPWRKRQGAGPVSVNLVHDIDLMRYLAGEVVGAQALSTPSDRGFENESVAGSLLKFESGAIGTITVSDSIVAPWSWEMTSREYPIYPSTAESSYLIGGSHGSLSIPDLRLWTYQDGRRDWWTPISSTYLKCETSDPLVNQVAHFVDVARGIAAPLVSGWEGLKTLQVIEAIQDASISGQQVKVGHPQEAGPEPAAGVG